MTTWTVGWFKRLRKPRGGGTSAKSKTRSLMERLFPCLLRKRPVDEVMFPPCSPTEMAAYAPPPPPPRVIPREYIHVKTQRVGGKQVPFSRREVRQRRRSVVIYDAIEELSSSRGGG
ncbi:hypothetical protein AeRB84_000717 [Aphanomyces euteiches]|nr:hypothetical protein AeRB84_000717 [Aphanomyces euteiches]